MKNLWKFRNILENCEKSWKILDYLKKNGISRKARKKVMISRISQQKEKETQQNSYCFCIFPHRIEIMKNEESDRWKIYATFKKFKRILSNQSSLKKFPQILFFFFFYFYYKLSNWKFVRAPLIKLNELLRIFQVKKIWNFIDFYHNPNREVREIYFIVMFLFFRPFSEYLILMGRIAMFPIWNVIPASPW